MNLAVLQRMIALAAVALVAGVAVLALTGEAANDTESGPQQVPVAGDGGWYTALAGSRGAARDAERTTCALTLTARSLGVSHPVLPCGAKIFISYGGAEVLTEVIDTKLKRARPPVRADRGARATARYRRHAADPLALRDAVTTMRTARPCTWPCV